MVHFPNTYTSKKDILSYVDAGKISAEILEEVSNATKVGVSPFELNELTKKLCKKHKVKPAFLGVPGDKSEFPGHICINVNDETLHAIPFSKRPIQEGDIVKLDFGIIHKNFVTDHCLTVGIEPLTKEEKHLINTAKLCIATAIKRAIAGNTVGDIGYALDSVASLEGFDYVKNYVSHGIGKLEHGGLHCDPKIPSYGVSGEGFVLEEGLTITIENQLSLGNATLKQDPDGWTLRTKDGSKTAMFEHTVMVGRDEVLVLTALE